VKIWAYVILVTLITGALGTAAKFIHDAGYDKRDTEIRDDAVVAQNKAIEKGIADWVETQDQAEATIIEKEVIVEKIRVVEKEIPKIVERIVTLTPECADLGDDFAGLLNKQIRASNGSQGSSSDIAPGLDAGVP